MVDGEVILKEWVLWQKQTRLLKQAQGGFFRSFRMSKEKYFD